MPSVHQVRLVSSDRWATTPLTMTLAGGRAQASVALATTGGQTLTAYDLDEPAVASMVIPPIAVTAAAASHFQFSTLPAGVTAGQPIDGDDPRRRCRRRDDPDLRRQRAPGRDHRARHDVARDGHVQRRRLDRPADVLRRRRRCDRRPARTTRRRRTRAPAAAVDVTPGAWTGLQVLLPGQSALPGTTAGVVGDARSGRTPGRRSR